MLYPPVPPSCQYSLPSGLISQASAMLPAAPILCRSTCARSIAGLELFQEDPMRLQVAQQVSRGGPQRSRAGQRVQIPVVHRIAVAIVTRRKAFLLIRRQRDVRVVQAQRRGDQIHDHLLVRFPVPQAQRVTQQPHAEVAIQRIRDQARSFSVCAARNSYRTWASNRRKDLSDPWTHICGQARQPECCARQIDQTNLRSPSLLRRNRVGRQKFSHRIFQLDHLPVHHDRERSAV